MMSGHRGIGKMRLIDPVLLIWILAFVTASVAHMLSPFNPCRTSGHALWLPYTGYKIQRQIIIAPKPGQSFFRGLFSSKFNFLNAPLHQIVITKCEYGFVRYEAVEPFISDNIYNTTINAKGLTETSIWKVSNARSNIERKFKNTKLNHLWKIGLEFGTKNIWNRTICTIREPSPYESDAGWAKLTSITNYATFPTTDTRVCFRLARRHQYIFELATEIENEDRNNKKEFEKHTHMRAVVPGALVGALFECIPKPFGFLYTVKDEDYKALACTPRTVRPVLPLLADQQLFYKSKLRFTHVSRHGVVTVRVPLFYTPDLMDRDYPRLSTEWAVPPGAKALPIPHYVKHYYLDRNWARNIDPFEEYTKKN
jgi:hypothetical protein